MCVFYIQIMTLLLLNQIPLSHGTGGEHMLRPGECVLPSLTPGGVSGRTDAGPTLLLGGSPLTAGYLDISQAHADFGVSAVS